MTDPERSALLVRLMLLAVLAMPGGCAATAGAAAEADLPPADGDAIVYLDRGVSGRQYVKRHGAWVLERCRVPSGWYGIPPIERLAPPKKRGWWDRGG